MSNAGAVRTGSEPPAAAALELASGAGAARQWPLRSHLELSALETAVPCARMHARLVVIEWALPELADATELVVSELVTNAHDASHGMTMPVLRIWLASDGSRVLVRVWDASGNLPVRRDAPPDAERGRGLMIVDSLSKEWGAYRADGEGKITWAVLEAVRE